MIKRTLYFSQPAYLSLRNGQLVFKSPDGEQEGQEVVRTFPIEDLGIVVLDHKQIVLTHGVIDALLANNCALITCDGRNMPSGLMLPLEGNTVQHERFIAQIEASLPLRKQLWQQTVRMKIANQAAVLQKHTDTEVRCMQKWADDVKSGDSDNLEGRAAVYYWKNLFRRKMPFFTRGREGEPPNNLLNYGYAILRAVVARALVSSGLLPTLGIHHHNRYNAYCLADDIMEPYRPYVDEVVLDIVRKEDYAELTRTHKAQLLSIPTLDVFINNQHSPLMIAVTTTTASLARCFGGESRKIIYPELS